VVENFDMGRFNNRKSNDVEAKKQYITSKYKTGMQLWKTWMMWTSIGFGKILGRNIKTSAKENLGHYELKQHKPCFEEKLSKYQI
jgi:hypothetical protein